MTDAILKRISEYEDRISLYKSKRITREYTQADEFSNRILSLTQALKIALKEMNDYDDGIRPLNYKNIYKEIAEILGVTE